MLALRISNQKTGTSLTNRPDIAPILLSLRKRHLSPQKRSDQPMCVDEWRTKIRRYFFIWHLGRGCRIRASARSVKLRELCKTNQLSTCWGSIQQQER